MSETTHYQNSPLTTTIKAGQKFAYCTCGHSNKFPSCDGAHKSYGGKPIKFILVQDQEVTLCRCGNSNNLPYCDSSHLS
jgi:CDGSH-type Zn-finger protein